MAVRNTVRSVKKGVIRRATIGLTKVGGTYSKKSNENDCRGCDDAATRSSTKKVPI